MNDAGKMTMTLTGTRQILEDVRSIPFQNLRQLERFRYQQFRNASGSDPERDIARRWRYALEGRRQWIHLYGCGEGGVERPYHLNSASPNTSTSMSRPFGAKGTISVVNQTATLSRITITITIPGRTKTVSIATLVSRM